VSYLECTEGRVAYELTGTGPRVLCVPGMGDLRSSYRFLHEELLAAGYCVVLMDLRGHGDSDTSFSHKGRARSSSHQRYRPFSIGCIRSVRRRSVARKQGPRLGQIPGTARAASTLDSWPWTLASPSMLLRGEGAVALITAIGLYGNRGGTWPLFLALLLTPDLSALGYLLDSDRGAVTYNAAHTYLGPVAFGVGGFIAGQSWITLGALIWAAHIGMDRLLGCGLKTGGAFQNTHLSGQPAGEVRAAAGPAA
jgi:pimeloyl-ACP methyl ester carboxylesterase